MSFSFMYHHHDFFLFAGILDNNSVPSFPFYTISIYIAITDLNIIINRPISQTVFMLSIAINRAEQVYATVIIKHNYMLMCNHKIVINIMLCLLNSTGHI